MIEPTPAAGVPEDVPERPEGRLRHVLARAGPRAVGPAAGRWWQGVRPRSRRGAILGIAAVLGGAALLSVVFLGGAALAWSPYVQTDLHPDTNPRQWAALEPAFAGAGLCRTCHVVEATRLASARHADIGCESCHGPLRTHALASAATLASTANPVVPTDAVCVRCHASASGRPDDLLQITPGAHYVLRCLQCHDPHTAISHRPPVVLHPLENLPPCVTCHGPDGFKARSQRHPVVTDDERCLDCHAPGRGPDTGT